MPPNAYCDTTGALNKALAPGIAITFSKTAVLRCVQDSAQIMRTYIIGERLPDLPVVSIAVDPFAMFDSVTGIYAMGPDARPTEPYYGANFWQNIELPIHIDFFESGAKHAWSYLAEMKISGNRSRKYPKKSVAIGFKKKYGQEKLEYSLFPEHPSITQFKWFVLRNTGNSYGLDYIRDMLMTSLTEGLGIDYQKGRAVIVYYNGKYFGIHNMRERSNWHYFETNYGIKKKHMDMAKANNEVTCGSDDDYQDILRWIENIALDGNNMKMLERRIDVDNFTNIFQSEIYFANRDWPGNNMKRWRSNAAKWKWFLHDTDLGFEHPDKRNKDIKMLDMATNPNGPNWPNPPHSTLIFRKLLQNENYRNAFINRFSLLLSTYFAPERVDARINALMQPIANEIPLDQKRWNFDADLMNSQLAAIREFGKNRAAQTQTEIEQFFGLPDPLHLTLSVKGTGKILVHNLPIPSKTAKFKVYSAVPITIMASGAGFKGWSDGVKDAERTLTVTQAMELKAEFLR
ncbi:MAG: CotH kinase family protein [Fibromonadales bacterium]|nr:CotH kinase family protein [Fibromonadales bacterium]